MRKQHKPWIGLLVLIAVALGPAAFGQSIPVSTTVIGGTRTLTLMSASGGSLDSIALGPSGSAPFMGNVTDVRYSRAGYQVSASLSDLYAHTGSAYDCDKKLASSDFELGFVVQPISVADVGAVTQPVWDLTGSITGALALLLGIPSGTVISAEDVAGETIDRNLSGLFGGLENSLPIKVSEGTSGNFASPAPHVDCDPTPGGSPTARTLMSGTSSDLAEMFTWVTDAIMSNADLNGDDVVTGSELVSAGEVADEVMADVVRQALIDAGVDAATLNTLLASGTLALSTVYDLLTATLDPVTALLGQTGTYVAVPQLISNVPGGASPGTYRGTLVVTMVDV